VPISAYFTDIPRPIWIVAMVLGFVWWWPVGLVVLAGMQATRRYRRGCVGPGRWYNAANQGAPANGPWGGGPLSGGPFSGGWGRWGNAAPTQPAPSGNRAFDEYRADTLRRLEEEQREFVEYLERLRQAKDKSEFDAFMADRRRPVVPPEHPDASA
jgi:hypothetical protein